MRTDWTVKPVGLPLIRRRCPGCASGTFRTTGKFRVNANHKLLDIWLLALCTQCDWTTKITVIERTHVRSISSDLLDRAHENDPGLAAESLRDGVIRRRNHIALDWKDAWRLDTGGSKHLGHHVTDVSVRFDAHIPVRPARIIAEGYGLSRAEVERLITEGGLVSAVRLSGKLSSDFAFTLHRRAS
ncbi:DUF1062 domain-containing protein [Streptomyces spiramenti]|uniref:DUF1062 domain-containing protein n=1 Tax=Streptomyces spiramenti TaxID=2720606 RepID=A0ABX1AI08_9ACTN|nr:DUF1062 domain-containing protein [Streptomyces spiramenti]NJP65291.1 DUF1062 domain-containing protein [Streptomyces spiramenti]